MSSLFCIWNNLKTESLQIVLGSFCNCVGWKIISELIILEGRTFVIFSCGFWDFLKFFLDSSFRSLSHPLFLSLKSSASECPVSLTVIFFFPECIYLSSVYHSQMSSNSFVWTTAKVFWFISLIFLSLEPVDSFFFS